MFAHPGSLRHSFLELLCLLERVRCSKLVEKGQIVKSLGDELAFCSLESLDRLRCPRIVHNIVGHVLERCKLKCSMRVFEVVVLGVRGERHLLDGA